MTHPWPPHPLILRYARLDDARELHDACFPQQEMEPFTDYLAWCLEGGERPTRVLGLLGDRIVAHAELMLRQGGAWVEVSNLAVTAQEGATTTGARFVRGLQRLALRAGAGEIRLQVATRDLPAIRLYRGWGLAPYGTPLGGRIWLAARAPGATPPINQRPRPVLPAMDVDDEHSILC